MRVAMFSAKAYDVASFRDALQGRRHAVTFLEDRLRVETAPLAAGHDAVCVFVNDTCDAPVVGVLAGLGVRAIQKGPLPGELRESLRSAEGLVRLKGEPAWVILPYRVTIR